MNEQQSRTLEVINRLYAAERRSMLPRLAETGAFVSWASTGDQAAVQKMTAQEEEHLAWLAEAAEQCGGSLHPAGPDARTGHLHYLDLNTMLPLVVRSIEELVRVYKEAGELPLTLDAADALFRILSRHTQHLEQLRQLHERATAAKP
jgi:uncharacterized protein YciI